MKTANLSPIELRTAITGIIDEVGYKTDKVNVTVFGIPYTYTERELRALQVLVARTSQDNPEEARNLCDNITIYYPYADCKEVHILPDGRLDNPLPGFLDVNKKLVFKILQ